MITVLVPYSQGVMLRALKLPEFLHSPWLCLIRCSSLHQEIKTYSCLC